MEMKDVTGITEDGAKLISNHRFYVKKIVEKNEYKDGNPTGNKDGFNVFGMVYDGELMGEALKIQVQSTNGVKNATYAQVTIEKSKAYIDQNGNYPKMAWTLSGSIKPFDAKAGK